MTSTFQEPGTSTTGGEGVDDGHHPSERRNRWFDYPITTLSPTVDHADNRVNEEAMMAWFEGYSNKTDTTSPADGSDMFETKTLSKKSKQCASDVRDNIAYHNIVDDDHEGYTNMI